MEGIVVKWIRNKDIKRIISEKDIDSIVVDKIDDTILPIVTQSRQ